MYMVPKYVRAEGEVEETQKANVEREVASSFLPDSRSRTDHFPSSEVPMFRFPDMIGRPPEYSGEYGSAAASPCDSGSGYGTIPCRRRRESKFQVPILCTWSNKDVNASMKVSDLGPGPHGVPGPGERPGEHPDRTSVHSRSAVRSRETSDWPNDRPSGIKLVQDVCYSLIHVIAYFSGIQNCPNEMPGGNTYFAEFSENVAISQRLSLH